MRIRSTWTLERGVFHREPSAESLAEMPELDFATARRAPRPCDPPCAVCAHDAFHHAARRCYIYDCTCRGYKRGAL